MSLLIRNIKDDVKQIPELHKDKVIGLIACAYAVAAFYNPDVVRDLKSLGNDNHEYNRAKDLYLKKRRLLDAEATNIQPRDINMEYNKINKVLGDELVVGLERSRTLRL